MEMRTREKLSSKSAQMTVELAIAFPILIVVACLMVNALGFATECARFDRVSRNVVRTETTSPLIDENSASTLAKVSQTLEGHFVYPNETTNASIKSDDGTNITFECELKWSPTLFGLGLKSEVFGVEMFELTHKNFLTVDPTRAGDVF